jgi:hypothetical protein
MRKTSVGQKEDEVLAVTHGTCREDRGIHARHVEQLVRFKHAMAEPILGPMNISAMTPQHIPQPDACTRDS